MARATWASILGRHDDAIKSARRAVALEPSSYYVRADLAFYYLAAGRNDEAATSSHDVLSVNPSFLPALAYSLTANERLGRWAEAATAARALMRAYGAPAEDLRAFAVLSPREAVRSWRRWDLSHLQALAAGRTDEFSLELALKSAAAGDHGAALDYLERAHKRRSAMLVFLRAYPELAGLRGDPRFERIASAVSSAGAVFGAG
jgi:tetratricopeptide (TPR) repeat protein